MLSVAQGMSVRRQGRDPHPWQRPPGAAIRYYLRLTSGTTDTPPAASSLMGVEIRKAPSTITTSLRTSVRYTSRATITVTVKAPRITGPSGTVTIYSDSKKVASMNLPASFEGQALPPAPSTVEGPALDQGGLQRQLEHQQPHVAEQVHHVVLGGALDSRIRNPFSLAVRSVGQPWSPSQPLERVGAEVLAHDEPGHAFGREPRAATSAAGRAVPVCRCGSGVGPDLVEPEVGRYVVGPGRVHRDAQPGGVERGQLERAFVGVHRPHGRAGAGQCTGDRAPAATQSRGPCLRWEVSEVRRRTAVALSRPSCENTPLRVVKLNSPAPDPGRDVLPLVGVDGLASK